MQNNDATDAGRVLADRAGGAVAPEPRAASQPVGAHPSREPLGAFVGLTSATNRKYPDAADVSGGSFTFLPISAPLNLDDLQSSDEAPTNTPSRDTNLVAHAVRIARPRYRSKAPRWVAVMDVFAVGRTAAIELCDRFGLNADELRVRR
jgi:hypothetical protein